MFYPLLKTADHYYQSILQFIQLIILCFRLNDYISFSFSSSCVRFLGSVTLQLHYWLLFPSQVFISFSAHSSPYLVLFFILTT